MAPPTVRPAVEMFNRGDDYLVEGYADVTCTLDLARDDTSRAALPAAGPPSGTDVPEVVAGQDFTVGGLVVVTLTFDVADGDWVVLRPVDPPLPNPAPGPRSTR